MANNKIVTLDNLTTYNNKIQDKITSINNVVAILDIEGDGNSYLANDGTYKTLNIPAEITSIQIDGTVYYPENKTIDLGYIRKNLLTTTSSSMILLPNTYHINTNTSLTTLTITLGEVDNPNIINEYFVEFNTSNNGTTISLPSSIKWQNGEYPTFENNTTYQISIVNNLGICAKFK